MSAEVKLNSKLWSKSGTTEILLDLSRLDEAREGAAAVAQDILKALLHERKINDKHIDSYFRGIVLTPSQLNLEAQADVTLGKYAYDKIAKSFKFIVDITKEAPSVLEGKECLDVFQHCDNYFLHAEEEYSPKLFQHVGEVLRRCKRQPYLFIKLPACKSFSETMVKITELKLWLLEQSLKWQKQLPLEKVYFALQAKDKLVLKRSNSNCVYVNQTSEQSYENWRLNLEDWAGLDSAMYGSVGMFVGHNFFSAVLDELLVKHELKWQSKDGLRKFLFGLLFHHALFKDDEQK